MMEKAVSKIGGFEENNFVNSFVKLRLTRADDLNIDFEIIERNERAVL